jgi:hypothetical protein
LTSNATFAARSNLNHWIAAMSCVTAWSRPPLSIAPSRRPACSPQGLVGTFCLRYRISAGFGLALAAVSTFVNFRSPGGSASIVFVMGGMTLLLLFLASAFGSAARHMSKGTNASLRNFAPWALVVLLLLALFTLFQLRAGF